MEPTASVNRWYNWNVRGTEPVLSNVIRQLEANLPTGWAKVTGDELKPLGSDAGPNTSCYKLNPNDSRAGVILTVDRRTLFGQREDVELRGRRVWFTPKTADRQPHNVPAAWEQVTVFLDNAILPAARSAGATVWAPTPDDLFLSDLLTEVAERLRAFSTSTRKTLPLNRGESELWQSFILAAYRGKAAVDPQRFVDWLTGAGWPQEAALELNLRFFDQCRLLGRYAEEVSAA